MLTMPGGGGQLNRLESFMDGFETGSKDKSVGHVIEDLKNYARGLLWPDVDAWVDGYRSGQEAA